MPEEIKLGRQVRDFGVAEIVVEKRDAGGTRLSFSLSSEAPVERWFGTEILSHEKKAIRLDRAKGGAMPLLFNHNLDDPIGMIDSARVVEGRLVVDAHMFDTDRAREIGAMLDGGLRNVSVGYKVHTFEQKAKEEIYRAIDWEPLEGSIVTMPADASVGLGRSEDAELIRVIRTNDAVSQAWIDPQKDVEATRQLIATAKASPPAAVAATQGAKMAETQAAAGATTQAPQITVTENGAPGMSGEQYEKKRGEAIRKNAQAMGITDPRTVEKWIKAGTDWDQIGDEAIKILEERGRQATLAGGIGMTVKEQSRYSLLRGISAMVSRNFADAGLEFEVSRELSKRIGKVTTDQTFYMPMDVQQRVVMQVGTGSMGGFTVGTDIQGFVDILRNRSVVIQSGARTLSGLQGVVAIPKKAVAGGVQWIAEAGTGTTSEMTLSQITISPKALIAGQQYTKQLLLQGLPDVDSLISMDLADGLAIELDRAALVGTTGSTNPVGVRFTAGIGTANPGTGSAVAYADLIKFQTTVAAANALLPGFTYVTTPAVAGIFMGKSRFTNSDTPMWQEGLLNGTVIGMPGKSTVQMLSGVMLAGDFSQVLIGQWQGLQIDVNPYSNFMNDIVAVKATLYADVAVRYPGAFAVGTAMTA